MKISLNFTILNYSWMLVDLEVVSMLGLIFDQQ
jgi:hypothetical protein